MAIEVKFRRGSANQHNSFTGANGEITVDTTNKTLRVHDGVTVGGERIAKYSELSSIDTSAINGSIIPAANNVFDLGTEDNRWRSLYLSNNTIYLDSVSISVGTNNTIRFVSSVTNEPTTIEAASIKLTSNAPSTFENVSITNLVLNNVLGVQYGGTGKTSLTQNGVMYASNSTAFAFATGSNGKIMQIGTNGVPKFDDVDGGSFP
jgi:hypothetical protein